MLESELSSFLVPRELKLLNTRRFKSGYLWEVEKVHFRNGSELCPHCLEANTVKAGKATSIVRDEPIREQKIYLKIYKHRYYCKDCKRYFIESVKGIWPRRRTTQRFREHVSDQCGKYINLDLVRRHNGVSNGFVYQVYYERAEVRLRKFKSNYKWPEILGIDEHFFRRSGGFTQFVTIFTDLKKKKVFELAEGKIIKNIIEQVEEIPGRENVKVVVIDMSGTYRSLIKRLFPNARIIADKFHVLRLWSPHIMKEGKKISGHRQELSMRKCLLKNRTKLEYFFRSDIDHYLKNFPDLDELYRFKERLYEFYRSKGMVNASRSYERLIRDMENSKLEQVHKIKMTLKRWRSEILLYFEKGWTNAFTEMTNRTAKLVQLRGCGYKSFKNYRLRVLSACLF